MRAIDYTIGETKTWRVAPRVAGGALADLAGASAELRITAAAGVCLRIAAAPDAQGFAFELSPASVDLPSGRYHAALWIRWPGGELRAYGDWVLIVRKGC
ncbi:hypothetical protein [Paracoccus contaminans]|uniref:DUF3859 domain-containing protein n=1 Tax=Paracoccus contaminans TaxID=1945662 RepID=A0A1W6CYY6_9RHOB|nr:hypothetical protein [Paracoccus contaminans]ARJ70078.1 hypothetical protein B0A89_10980 [Paracoccus contaminans]